MADSYLDAERIAQTNLEHLLQHFSIIQRIPYSFKYVLIAGEDGSRFPLPAGFKIDAVYGDTQNLTRDFETAQEFVGLQDGRLE